MVIHRKREWTRYLTQGFRSIDNPSIKFPLRQMSKELENALRILNGDERTVAVYVPGQNLDASKACNLILSMYRSCMICCPGMIRKLWNCK